VSIKSTLARFPRLHRAASAVRRLWRKPPRTPLDGARSIAFIAPSRSDGQGRRWTADAAARGIDIDILPLAQPYRRDDGQVMSFLLPPPREKYDGIVVSRSIDLFDHSWSYAFLDRVNALLSDRGTMLVAKPTGPERYIPEDKLIRMFGRAPRGTAGRYLEFDKAKGGLRRPAEAPRSTLDAYWALSDNLINARFDERLSETILALGVDHVRPRKPNFTDDLLELMQSQSYRTSSACTKSAMIEHIASVCFPDRRDLRLADLGAGTALNSLELLLGPGRIAHVTLVEPHWSYHWDIAAVYDWLGERVRGKVSLAGKQVETYSGTPVDIAMVCGVFSILSVEQREPFLQSAWSNVAPGGILAVLENMRDPDPVRGGAYNATRFTPPEIDAFLGRLAPIRYFPADAAKEISADETGNSAVFRVMRKPS